MNIDSSSWHPEDSAVHIALVFCWLINSGRVDESVLEQWKLNTPLDEHKTPTQYLSYCSDGKLRSDYIKPEWADMVKRAYDESYLKDIENIDALKVQRNNKMPMPFNIIDSWDNVKIVGEYFETKLAA